jgi:hypothetical protein
MQYDTEYRDSEKHQHNQKIAQMAITGAILPSDHVRVTHNLTCALLFSRKNYCDCDAKITVIQEKRQ